METLATTIPTAEERAQQTHRALADVASSEGLKRAIAQLRAQQPIASEVTEIDARQLEVSADAGGYN